MRNVTIAPIIVALVLGLAAGGGITYWWLAPSRSALAAESGARAEAEDTCAKGSCSSGGAAADKHDTCSTTVKDAHTGEAGPEGEAGCIVLSEKAIRESGIETSEAAGGELEQTVTLPAEIALNADRVAHIVPRVEGMICRVDKNQGDDVQAGDVLAVLESRELAEAKTAYLSAQQRLALAEVKLQSAEELHAQQITPDLEFRSVQMAKTAAEIELRASENKLHTLGVSEEQIKELPNNGAGFALYELRAPFAGTVVSKHCSLGEVLNSESDAFVLADLSTVWANITVYSQDMGRVRIGQTVHIRSDVLGTSITGKVCYMTPVANEATRTIYARVDLPNADRAWRPGTFVTASIVLDSRPVPILIPTDAVQRLKTGAAVFIFDGDGFEPRPVTVGRTGGTQSEILAGLEAGQKYVTKGAFILKAELGKGTTAGCQH